MLTISKPLSSSQAQTYHAKEFMSAEQNYWKQGDTILGEWQGRMAERYGLAGAIDEQHFARLSEGQNPLTGEQLVRHRNGQEYTTADGTTVKPVEHRAGWDATFSAPKSVSLTALVGGDDRVREAHRQAVTTALTELERYTQARIGGNHAAETTGKFVAAKFEHDTARPVDGYAAPQLHTHAVIFNMTERADGSTRAVQPQSYFDSQQFATAVYQSELMYRLSRLGYEITPGRSGAPEIKGYTQEYLDASSPRSQQIREYLEKSGFAGPEAAQIAAHSTRDKKEIHTPSEVLAAHRQLAAEFGNQADRVVVEARARASAQEQTRVPNIPERVQEAVTFAKSRNFEREAVTDERDIMRDALRRGMGDLTYSQVRDNFEQRQAHRRVPARTRPEARHRAAVHHPRCHCRGACDHQAHAAGPVHSRADHASRGRRRPRPYSRVPESGATKGHRGGAHLARTGYMGCRGWRAAAKPRPLRPSVRARSETDTPSRASLPQVEPPVSSGMPAFRPTPCKVFWRGEAWSGARATPTPGTFICSTNPVSPAPGRCNRFSKRLGRRTGFCSLATPGSTRASMLESPSSRCRRPECGHRSLTRSCARKTRNCYAPSNISLATRRPPAFNFFSSRAALPRFPTASNASRPSPRIMSHARRTRWLSRPTTPAAATSTMPSAPSCRAAARYPKTITR